MILQEAKEKADEERRKLSELTEQEKEKLVDMKREIKALKQEITKTLKKYELDLEKVVEFAGDIEGMENMNKDETKMTSPKTTMMRYLMLFLRKSWKSMPANPTLKF